MRIIHVINSLATGGAERLVVNLAQCGVQMGHDVSILLLKESPGIPREIADIQGIPITVLGSSLKDPRLIVRLRQACEEADVVHVHIFPAFYWAAFIDKPKVYTEHSAQNRRRDSSTFRRLERWAYTQYDRTIVISEGVESSLREHLRSIGANPQISFVANGISRDFFEVSREYSTSPKKVAIVGSLRPVKQHSVAIKAISLLEDITLNIAGDGPLREDLETLVQELAVEERVHFLGNIKNVPEFLSEQDLLLSTSEWEGMSTVAVEAQATGIPVVGADVPGIRDVVLQEETGLLYSGADPLTVAETIERALSPKLYPQLCGNVREHASQYSIESSFETQLAIYEELLK